MKVAVIVLLTIIVAVCVTASVGYVASQDLDCETLVFSTNKKVSLKIAHISDLHFPFNGVELTEILDAVKSVNPDVIALTGDMLDDDGDKEDVISLGKFFAALAKIARCYLVIGNHEIGSPLLDYFIEVTAESGVITLDNKAEFVPVEGGRLAVIGLSDAYPYDKRVKNWAQIRESDLKILLAHRPELVEDYASVTDDKKPDFIFSGHAHGGLLRMGKLAFYAPNQGVFPKYTSGAYVKNGSTMIVSRGLGISGVDYRFFNKYHIPIAEIKAAE